MCENHTGYLPASYPFTQSAAVVCCTLTSKAHIGACLQANMEREGMMVQSIYYGEIGRDYTERLLERYGREGSFLLRDSESVQGAFCLCVRKTPFVHTYRLLHTPDGWSLQLVSGDIPQCFGTLEALIDSYRRGAASNTRIPPLTMPLDKTQLGDNSLETESVYLEM